MAVSMDWQILKNRAPWIERAKIPGGWLVTYESNQGNGITFVPDPDHIWNGDTLP